MNPAAFWKRGQMVPLQTASLARDESENKLGHLGGLVFLFFVCLETDGVTLEV